MDGEDQVAKISLQSHRVKHEDYFDPLSRRVIGCALQTHSKLGPGLVESIYEECMSIEMTRAGIRFQRQVEYPIIYDGVPIGGAVRLDFVVEGVLCVELKAVEHLINLHRAQVHTYLKVSGLEIGLLINFDSYLLKDGIKRITRAVSKS